MKKTNKEQKKSEEAVIKNLASSDSLKDFFRLVESVDCDKHISNLGKLFLLDIVLCIIFVLILGVFVSSMD